MKWLERRVAREGMRPRLAAFVVLVCWIAAVVVFGVAEALVDPATFDNVWLGIWWAIQTVTTVGYGDVVPEQTVGKVMAGFLMLGGLSFLAVVTGVITSVFVTVLENQRRRSGDDPMMQKIEELSAQLAAVRAELERLPAGSGPARPH